MTRNFCSPDVTPQPRSFPDDTDLRSVWEQAVIATVKARVVPPLGKQKPLESVSRCEMIGLRRGS